VRLRCFASPSMTVLRCLIRSLKPMRSASDNIALDCRGDEAILPNQRRPRLPFAQNSPRAALAPIIKANAEEQPPQAAPGRRGIHLIYYSRLVGHSRTVGQSRFAGWFGFVRNRTIRCLSDADRATRSRAIGQRSRAAIHLDMRPSPGQFPSLREVASPKDRCWPGAIHTNWKLA
jgi:hypothetical protein